MKDKIIQFLQSVGCENIEARRGSNWVNASCPLAPWFHEKGTDRNPSFGVKIPTGDEEAPVFHCFSCGASGPLPKLLHDLQWLRHEHLKEASRILTGMPNLTQGEARKRRRVKVSRDKFEQIQRRRILRNTAVPQEVLDRYPRIAGNESPEARELERWLSEDRGVSVQLIAQYDLRLYVNRFNELGVVFPIVSRDGKTVKDMYVRMVADKKDFRLTNEIAGSSVEWAAPHLWFGNQFFDPERPLMLVEGPIDVLRLRTLGVQNVWGCMGGGPSRDQMETVNARVVYFAFDADEAGKGFIKRAAASIQAASRFVLDWGVVGKKDGGDLEDIAEFKRVFQNRVKLEKAVAPVKSVRPKRKGGSARHLKFDPFDGI